MVLKTRIAKLYSKWVVEFPFKVTVYCNSFGEALSALASHDFYYKNRWIA